MTIFKIWVDSEEGVNSQSLLSTSGRVLIGLSENPAVGHLALSLMLGVTETAIEKAVAKLDTLRQTSSDSAITRTRKRSIKAVTDPFKAIKGAVVTVENTKIKKSSKAPVVLSKKSKVERVRSKGAKKPKTITIKDLLGALLSKGIVTGCIVVNTGVSLLT